MGLLNHNKLRADTMVEWTSIGRKEAEEDNGSGLQYRILQKLEDYDGQCSISRLANELGRPADDIIVAVEQLMSRSMVRRAG